ncbi:MAG: hypothetical protein ACTSWL_03435, partial [Promethearchaeota archaeon]
MATEVFLIINSLLPLFVNLAIGLFILLNLSKIYSQYKFTRLSLYSQIGVYIFGIIGPIFNLLSVILYMNMNS